MKYLFLCLIAAGSFMAASAQFDRNDYYRNNGWHERSYREGYGNRYQLRVQEINHEYDQKVWQVQNDYSLTPRDQRRIIHEINEERTYRLRALRREERRHRDWDGDGD